MDALTAVIHAVKQEVARLNALEEELMTTIGITSPALFETVSHRSFGIYQHPARAVCR